MMRFHPAQQSIRLLQYRPGTSFNDSVALSLPKRYRSAGSATIITEQGRSSRTFSDDVKKNNHVHYGWQSLDVLRSSYPGLVGGGVKFRAEGFFGEKAEDPFSFPKATVVGTKVQLRNDAFRDMSLKNSLFLPIELEPLTHSTVWS